MPRVRGRFEDVSVRNRLFRNFDLGYGRGTPEVSTLNRVEASSLQALPVGNDTDHLGRDLPWRTQTIVLCKSSFEPQIAQNC
jgi:hypothetical protein